MHLRLWHRLFLAFAALSLLVLAGYALWQQQSFRLGFRAYLDDVAEMRLQPAAQRLAVAYRENGSDWRFLRDDPRRLGEYVDPRGAGERPPRPDDARRPAREPPPDALRDGERPPPPDDVRTADRTPPARDEHSDTPPPSDARDHGPRPADARSDGEDRRPPPRPPHPPGPPDLMPRLTLLDAASGFVAGRREFAETARDLPVVLDGTRIGVLRLAPEPAISDATDLGFAQAQTRAALVAAFVAVLVACVFALALARWLLAPVRSLTQATRALASGDYTRRIAATRRDELGALASDFNHLAATLEDNRDARRRWGADIAHELRTPLSVLRGEVQALQDGVRAPSAHAFDSLNTECERLGALIEDLYQLALADVGALDYRFEHVDLGALAREAAELQRGACSDEGLAIDIETAPVRAVRGDARRLGQLVDNLLANARRYTDAPGRIRIEVAMAGAEVRLLVEDTPPGVGAAERPQLFERLYRVDHSRSRAAAGAGLGLSICRAIVDAHGARIDALASPLGGLRIAVHFPAAKEPA